MTSSAPTLSAPRERVLSQALVAVALGVFMMQLDATVVNLALPDIGQGIGAGRSALQWVIDGYTLPLASCLLIGGRLADRYGHRRIFLVGLLIFGLSSALCALADSASWLISARVVQGFGAAIELPATLALLARTYTDETIRAKAIGVWASVAGLSLAIGPLVGGRLVDSLGWQSVFVINVPVVAVAAVLTWRSVSPDGPTRPTSLDLPGQLTGTMALVLITYAIITGPDSGWSSGRVVVPLVAGAVLVIAFAVLEGRTEQPLLPLRIMAHRGFAAVNLAATAMGFVLFGLLFAYSLYFQQVRGNSATAAGYRFLPLAIAFILIGPVTGRLGAGRRPRALIVAGLLMLAGSSVALAVLPGDVSYYPIAVLFIVIGLAYGLLAPTLAGAAIAALPRERAGLASAMNNTSRQLGGVLGVAFAGGQLAPHNTDLRNPTTLAMLGFAAAAGVALLAVLLLRTLKESSSDDHRS